MRELSSFYVIIIKSVNNSRSSDKVLTIKKVPVVPPLKKPVSFDELKRMTLKHARESKSEVFALNYVLITIVYLMLYIINFNLGPYSVVDAIKLIVRKYCI